MHVAIEKIRERIAGNLESLKKYTATPGNGCTRLPFTKEAREYFQGNVYIPDDLDEIEL